jgi:hypothetical protein
MDGTEYLKYLNLIRNFTYYIVLSEHNCSTAYYMDSISGTNNNQVIVLNNYITVPCL